MTDFVFHESWWSLAGDRSGPRHCTNYGFNRGPPGGPSMQYLCGRPQGPGDGLGGQPEDVGATRCGDCVKVLTDIKEGRYKLPEPKPTEVGWLDEELYQKAIRALPIVCVDLVVSRPMDRGDDQILMVLRKNEPLAGAWWFPGGRVLLGEARLEAAKRKLKQECGLVVSHAEKVLQRRTHDIVIPRSDGSMSHSLTTVFWVEVEWIHSTVILDAQSARYEWRTPRDWLIDETLSLHPWIQHRLRDWSAP